jgi:Arc/MetJ-type ribon-helix-helix transcriptional regulator
MTVELTSEQARIIREELRRGRFATPGEVIESALAAWAAQERQTDLRLRATPDLDKRLALLEERVRAMEMKKRH